MSLDYYCLGGEQRTQPFQNLYVVVRSDYIDSAQGFVQGSRLVELLPTHRVC